MKLALTSNVTFFKVLISYTADITYYTDIATSFLSILRAPFLTYFFHLISTPLVPYYGSVFYYAWEKTHLPGF